MSDPEPTQSEPSATSDESTPSAAPAAVEPTEAASQPTTLVPFALSEPPTTIYRGATPQHGQPSEPPADPIAQLAAASDDWSDRFDTLPVPPEHALPEPEPPAEASDAAAPPQDGDEPQRGDAAPVVAVPDDDAAPSAAVAGDADAPAEVAADAPAEVAAGAEEPTLEIRHSSAAPDAAESEDRLARETSAQPALAAEPDAPKAPRSSPPRPNVSAGGAARRDTASRPPLDGSASPAPGRRWIVPALLGAAVAIGLLARSPDPDTAVATAEELREPPAAPSPPTTAAPEATEPAAPATATAPAIATASAALPAIATASAALPASATAAASSSAAPDEAEPVALVAYKAATSAAQTAKNCRQRGDAPGRVRAYVTFGNDGRVAQTYIPTRLVNPMTRECIIARFSGITVPSYVGKPLTVGADVRLY